MIKKFAVVLFLLLMVGYVDAQIVPYYGKNNVKYDTFDWKTYTTQHFDIYFYPQSQAHLQRVASMAESAYDKISADLQHDVEFKIPLIFFKTQSEFEQVNYLQISEGILGAAEPVYNRMAFAIDQPSDKLQALITHELSHVFQFSMLFGGVLSPLARVNPPQWVFDGHADYETGVWDPADLMVVRDATLTERLPFVSVEQGLISPGGPELGRAPYNIGHAVYEFMKDRYGDAAIRQFWFYMKKATLLGAEDVMFSAFGVKEEVFNEQFSQYLRERFKDYREKQSPIDYGKEVGLPPKYFQIFSQAPSPNGREFAVMTANRDDFEFDILKIDRTGKIIKNLTGGLTTSYDYLTTDTYRFEGRNISWSSDGNHIAYFGRTGKRRSLFIVNAQSGSRIEKIGLKIDNAASPAISPDGRTVLFTGIKDGQPDLFAVEAAGKEVRKLTNDILFEKTPMWSPDGKWIFYTSRINSRDQIMRMAADNSKHVEQLTFSDYNSTSPYFDPQSNSIYFAADKNNAFNLYRLSLSSGDKDQYTDVIGGNFSPYIFRENGKERVAFTSFFKGEYRLFIMDLPKPITVIAAGSEPKAGETLQMTAEQASQESPQTQTAEATAATSSREFPTQGPVIADFQPKKEVRVDPTKIKDKKLKLVIGGRPEVITGVSGDTFAVASGVVLQDILGDQEFRFFTSRIRGFQSYNVGYLDLGHRLQFLTDFIFNDDFFFVQVPPAVAQETGFTIDIIRRRTYGGRFISQFPFNRYYRFEAGAGIFNLSERFLDDAAQRAFEQLPPAVQEASLLNDGGYMPLSFALVGETTKFREWGPIAGHTFRLSIDYAPAISDSFITRTIYEADLRKYFRLSSRSLLAARARGFTVRGKDQVIFSFGGGLDIRGFDFREIIGTEGGIGNFEYRFPLYPNPRVPLLGQMRGRVFLDYFKMRIVNDQAITSFRPSFFIIRNVDGVPFAIAQDEGAGSFGAGFTVFAGGLPLNFDFSKIFGHGRFPNENFVLDLTQPTQLKIVDGVGFDFSIGYEF